MKKQFDISMRPQIESGEYKVVTRDNHPAKILCWDAKGIPIVALVREEEETDIPYSYNNDGSFVWKEIHDEDLFVITPEPELTEFEKFFAKVLDSYNGVEIDVPSAVAAYAPTLLRLASKGLQPKYDATKVDEQLIEKMVNDKFKQFDMVVNPENTKHFYKQGLTDMYRQFAAELNEAFNHQDDVVYNQGYDKGTKDALKDIPSWQTGTPPYKSVWLTRTTHKDGHSTVACETFQNDKWPHEGDLNVLYLDMNKLLLLPIDYGKDNY